MLRGFTINGKQLLKSINYKDKFPTLCHLQTVMASANNALPKLGRDIRTMNIGSAKNICSVRGFSIKHLLLIGTLAFQFNFSSAWARPAANTPTVGNAHRWMAIAAASVSKFNGPAHWCFYTKNLRCDNSLSIVKFTLALFGSLPFADRLSFSGRATCLASAL